MDKLKYQTSIPRPCHAILHLLNKPDPRSDFNHRIATNLDHLHKLSIEQWEALSRYLLPAGHKEGYRWLAGSIHGEPGRSFDINFRTGVWGDWASDSEKGCGPISLWMAVKGVDFKTAIQQFSQFLGCQGDVIGTQHYRTETNEREKRILLPPGVSKPTERDLHILSWSRSIDVHALRIAAERGFIYCFDDKLNGRCWIYTDQRRRCAPRRRLEVLVGRDFLKVSLRSQLSKGAESQELHRYSVVPYGQEKCDNWQADFGGWLWRKGRLYWVGAYLRLDPTGVEYIRLCLRPEYAKKGFPLEAVR